jgi:hypothetical protein
MKRSQAKVRLPLLLSSLFVVSSSSMMLSCASKNSLEAKAGVADTAAAAPGATEVTAESPNGTLSKRNIKLSYSIDISSQSNSTEEESEKKEKIQIKSTRNIQHLEEVTLAESNRQIDLSPLKSTAETAVSSGLHANIKSVENRKVLMLPEVLPSDKLRLRFRLEVTGSNGTKQYNGPIVEMGIGGETKQESMLDDGLKMRIFRVTVKSQEVESTLPEPELPMK